VLSVVTVVVMVIQVAVVFVVCCGVVIDGADDGDVVTSMLVVVVMWKGDDQGSGSGSHQLWLLLWVVMVDGGVERVVSAKMDTPLSESGDLSDL
jgi:hypothetical protein